MGAADIIPGVSGGTMALITGIYERLINAIGNISIQTLTHLVRRDKKAFWDGVRAVDPFFMITLIAGIGVAALIMSQIILFLLETYAVETYALFFGIILASSLLIFAEIKRRGTDIIAFLIVGFAIGFIIAGLNPTSLGHSLPILFITGAIALCAMILPGISGAYITLLFNQYEYLLNAIHTIALPELITYMTGGVIGLLAFSRTLQYLLRVHHAVMLAFLTGLMLGSTRMLVGIITKDGGFGVSAVLFTIVGVALIGCMEYGKRRMTVSPHP
jgi:putative membrane protein